MLLCALHGCTLATAIGLAHRGSPAAGADVPLGREMRRQAALPDQVGVLKLVLGCHARLAARSIHVECGDAASQHTSRPTVNSFQKLTMHSVCL